METKQAEDGSNMRFHRPLIHGGRHPLGTDQVGMDVMYKGIKGIRTALIIGGAATLIAVPFALLFGIMAGYFGGWVDELITYHYLIAEVFRHVEIPYETYWKMSKKE